MNEYPIRRARRVRKDFYGIPKAAPGQGNMVCPTENKLMVWDFLPNQMLRCTGCGRLVSREDAT